MSEKNLLGKVEEEYNATIKRLAQAKRDHEDARMVESAARAVVARLETDALHQRRAALVLSGSSPKSTAMEDYQIKDVIAKDVREVDRA